MNNNHLNKITKFLIHYHVLFLACLFLFITAQAVAQETGDKDPLTSILQKHKGKVVYVDVWATWCLPCLFEMSNSRKLREKLSGKNVEFVYLCINSYDEKRWKKLIASKRIEGDNYLLSAVQSSALLQKYNIKGVPRYMLFDQDGDVVSEDAKRPGDAVVLKTIQDLLSK